MAEWPILPERPTPLMVSLLCGLLAAFLVALFLWRRLIGDLLWRDEGLKDVKESGHLR